YVRLQAGALYAKVLSERQAKSFLVDVIQISDMGMIYSVTDLAGLNRLSRRILRNAAFGIVGMAKARSQETDQRSVIGLSMFGVASQSDGMDAAPNPDALLEAWNSQAPR
ncbi:MAG: hypothetical protein EBZ60_02440, partial [Betaproteobacteria bacterium]|nr:hypothetical protein [Betaproteobacteria bacterium]